MNLYIALHQDTAARSYLLGRRTRILTMVKLITEKVSAWRRYRASVRELSRLTDRELAELGLSRSDIEAVARVSATF
jgi:uncharacterized protein YjiS (DUF1127 family)